MYLEKVNSSLFSALCPHMEMKIAALRGSIEKYAKTNICEIGFIRCEQLYSTHLNEAIHYANVRFRNRSFLIICFYQYKFFVYISVRTRS